MPVKRKDKTIFTVSEAARSRGVDNPHQLHRRTGISVNRSIKLWTGCGKIDLKDLDALCDTLSCKIKDIIRRVPASSD